MASAHHEVGREIRALLEANEALRAVAVDNRRALTRGLAMLERGTSMAQAMAQAQVADRRIHLAEVFAEWEYRRHRLRLAVTRDALAEGMTISELSRAFGFSRQLGARLAKEAAAQE